MGLSRLVSLSEREWRLAREKLVHDFEGSCLHDLELLVEAGEQCRRWVRLIPSHERLRLGRRLPHEPFLVPPLRGAAPRWASSSDPGSDLVPYTADLVRYSGTAPVVVDVGSYAHACTPSSRASAAAG